MAQLIHIWSVCNSASYREVLRQHLIFILQVGLLQFYCVSLLSRQKSLMFNIHCAYQGRAKLLHSRDCFTGLSLQRQTVLVFRIIWQLDNTKIYATGYEGIIQTQSRAKSSCSFTCGSSSLHVLTPVNGYQADLPILAGASDSSSSPTLQQGKLLVCVDIFKVFIIQIQQLELYP